MQIPFLTLMFVGGLVFNTTFLTADDRLQKISFNRDIRPILSAKCFACHGPDDQARESDLRLDLENAAIQSGTIVKGQPHQSELMIRINSEDADVQMPPPDSAEPLTLSQKALIETWIRQGAKFERHWAFKLPRKPAVPEVDELMATAQSAGHPVWKITDPDRRAAAIASLTSWPENEIDRFILRKILKSDQQPNPTADRYALIRRVYLDLTGLPPSPDEADAFVSDASENAYEEMVDRLLKSSAYGERWARIWLDLARYADTNGYEKDRARSIWPYRDWVIRAINADMPFDQFSIEQLAGDMLPQATNSQKVATGLHRNTMLNEEGGIDPLEYRYYAMVDRVATTGTIWLGLTTGCAQCHSHKYDPISHTDYFRFMAMLNNADEPDLEVADGKLFSRRQQLLEQVRLLETALVAKFLQQQAAPSAAQPDPVEGETKLKKMKTEFQNWINTTRKKVVPWKNMVPLEMKTNSAKLTLQNDQSIFASGDFTKRDVYQLKFPLSKLSAPISAIRIEALPDSRLPASGPGNAYYEGRKGDFFLSEFKVTIDGQKQDFQSGSSSYGKISIGSGTADARNVFDNEGSTGWSTSGHEGQREQLVLNFAKPVSGKVLDVEMIFERHFAASLGRFRIAITTHQGSQPKANSIPPEVERLLAQPQLPTDAQLLFLKKHFILTTPLLAKQRVPIEALRKKIPSLPQTMVMRERKPNHPRKTFRHHRGEYLSPREEVFGGLPELFQGDQAAPSMNRLNLATWLMGPKNPLAARVEINRYWQAFFGQGLVRSPGDFGTQSSPPSHPELLDFLAVQFREGGWSRKEVHRLIVTSATYRQSSRASTEDYSRDPENDLYSRGPRFRVDAEMVRDIVLKSAGKLSRKMYGPSVYPPQPASVTAIAYGSTPWKAAVGEDRYRRSLYTYSKRTAPFAAYQVFDSPTGENCIARRNRSNTPLQALTLLNDQMFLELAQAMAVEILKSHPNQDPKTIAVAIFRQLVTRPPEETEIQDLLEFQKKQLQRLLDGELVPNQIAGQVIPANYKLQEVAAWVMLARAIMNIDEVITKP